MRQLAAVSLVLCLLAPSAEATEVTFTFAPSAPVETVSVRGSFNAWGESAMSPDGEGVWSLVVDIEPGECTYKYFVDGQWPGDMATALDGGPMDPDAQDYVDDGFGGQNAIRFVGGTESPAEPLVEPAALRDGYARIHYHRPDGRYSGWGLHVWEDSAEDVAWDRPLAPVGRSNYGLFWDVRLAEEASTLAFLIHKGESKDPGPDQFLDLSEDGREVWIVSGRETLFLAQPDVSRLPNGDLTQRRAHWIAADTLLWPGMENASRVFLHHDPDGALRLDAEGVVGGTALELQRRGRYDATEARFPHLDGASLWLLRDADPASILKDRLALSAFDDEGHLLDATGLQIPGVLDDLFAYEGPLGVHFVDGTPSLSVWAPTARSVRLLLFDGPGDDAAEQAFEMREDRGVWSVTGTPEWEERYYLFEVTVYAPSTEHVETNRVTDPYSRSLSQDSRRSQVVDMHDPRWMPEGWSAVEKPRLDAPEDIVLYELHVRDFSASDALVPTELRGTFAAFALDSHGTRHLRSLADAGLTHVHLLPAFDIATIPEDRSSWPQILGLEHSAPASKAPQALLAGARDRDGYNWGYDPYHFGVPEGSYATDPDGAQRILEFRAMVKALADDGLRVVMDVVYNHTHASGQGQQSVFDRIVPGYYHRLDESGNVATSTCCQNTASEHRMMERFLVDDLVHWARDYKVDGFRFDLMGHHMRANLERARDALHALTLAEDGVDGSAIYLYGEGWDFGEVQGGARGVNATQSNMAGTGIGTFNDRIRDAVRGGSPFTDRREQGFATGLHHSPNGMPGSSDATKLRDLADRIRVGLAGNLRDFTLGDRRGADLGGYTLDPQESIQYVSAHDNETLFDKIQLAAPQEASSSQRIAMQRLALSVVAFAQGVPFFHAGSELLRSKSMDADSYNSGDWFNRLDFSGETTTWGAGLPNAEKNRDRWDIMRPLLEDPERAPRREEILGTADYFRGLLRIRHRSPLFRLRTGKDIRRRVHFHNLDGSAGPGLIAMSIVDVGDGIVNLDPALRQVLVLLNPSDESAEFGDPRFGRFAYELHPEMRGVEGASFDRIAGRFRVPARTAVVFVENE